MKKQLFKKQILVIAAVSKHQFIIELKATVTKTIGRKPAYKQSTNKLYYFGERKLRR